MCCAGLPAYAQEALPRLLPEDLEKELGLQQEGWLSFMLPVIRREGPHGMFVVPVGEKERQLIEADARGLLARVAAWIDQGTR